MTDLELIETITTQTTKSVEMSGPLKKHLQEMYQLIWCEACYDPDTDSSRKFAKRLLPHIEKLNEVLRFKT